MDERAHLRRDEPGHATREERGVERDDLAERIVHALLEPHGEPAQHHERGEVAIGEGDVGHLLGDRRARAHGHADVGRRERRRIVDAVAHHDDPAARGAHLLHHGVLVLGQKVGPELVDTRCRGDAACGVLVIAGEHDDVLKAELVQLAQSLGHAGLERVLDADNALELAVDR